MNVLEVLRVGFSGLVFLLAFLGYRLLTQALAQPTLDVKRLRVVSRFISLLVVLATLVAVLTVFGLVVNRSPISGIDDCRDSLSRLETYSRLPDQTADDYRKVIAAHLSRCEALARSPTNQ